MFGDGFVDVAYRVIWDLEIVSIPVYQLLLLLLVGGDDLAVTSEGGQRRGRGRLARRVVDRVLDRRCCRLGSVCRWHTTELRL